MLPEFDLLLPKSLDEALALLSEKGNAVTPVAGGTNVIIDFRGGRHSTPFLMNIQKLPELQHKIVNDNGKIVVGSGTTISEILENDEICAKNSSLKSAASVFANPLVRNRATLGGNIGDASPAADTIPPLLVLDAEIEIVDQKHARWIKLSDFFVGVRKTVRKPVELVKSIRWEKPSPSSFQAYHKIGLRKADAISVASVAVLLDFDPEGKCKTARIALGSVFPTPLRAFQAEKCLLGTKLEPAVIQEAAFLAAKACSPIDDIRGSAAYRRQMVQVLVARLITRISENKKEE